MTVGAIAARPSRATTAVACIVVAAALWGGTFVLIRDTVRRIDPVALVFARFALAAVPLALVAAARSRASRFAATPSTAGLGGDAPGGIAAATQRHAVRDRGGNAEARPPSTSADPLVTRSAAWRGGVAAGACAACGFVCQAIGLASTTAGTSAFLTSLGSLFAGLVAWPLLHQRPGRWLLAGIALATAGSALLAEPRGGGLGVGEAWTLLGAVGWAMQAVSLGRWAPRADPVTLSAVQAATIAALLAPFAWPAVAAAAWDAPGVAMGLVYLVVAASVAAPLLQVVAQRTLPPGRVGLLLGLEPVFALLFALTLGAERFPARWWAGAALILAAVSIVEWRSASASPTGFRRSTP